MTTDRNGGPAFPTKNRGVYLTGMSLRDWFAGQALPAVIDRMGQVQGIGSPTFWQSVRAHTYRAADAMLGEEMGPLPDALDTAWAQINALGGTAEPGDEAGAAVNRNVDQALALIEALGGRDPLKRRAA